MICQNFQTRHSVQISCNFCYSLEIKHSDNYHVTSLIQQHNLFLVGQTHPRFQGDSLAQNKRLRDRVQKIAYTRKCSLNQLALAWMHHKGRDLVPIPGAH